MAHWDGGGTPFAVTPVALAPDSIFILAENVAGSPTTATTDQISGAIIGGAASPANGDHRFNAFMRAYGINTY